MMQEDHLQTAGKGCLGACKCGVFVIGLALFHAGCMSNAVKWVETPVENVSKPVGKYVVKSGAQSTAINAHMAKVLGRDADDEMAEDVVPVSILLKKTNDKETTGALASFNNVFGYCTLGFWPIITGQEAEFDVTVSTPYANKVRSFSLGGRVWQSYLSPLSAIPCPGWGDVREEVRNSANIFSETDQLTVETAGKIAASCLDEAFYDKALGRKRKVLANFKEAAKRTEKSNMSTRDRRPIVLLDDQVGISIGGNNGSSDNIDQSGAGFQSKQKVGNVAVDMAKLTSKLEDKLMRLGFHVVSKRTMANDMRERELFSILTGNDVGTKLSSPAYRVSMEVFNSRVYLRQASTIVNSVGKRCVSEIFFKVTNLETAETEITKKYKDEAESKSMSGSYRGKHGHHKTMVGSGIKSDVDLMDEAIDKCMNQFFADFLPSFSYPIVACTDSGEVTLEIPEGSVSVGTVLSVLSREGAGRVKNEKEVARLCVKSVTRDCCVAEIESVKDTSTEWKPFVRIDRTCAGRARE